jgi:S1-C subfamily serine protease
LCNAVNGARVRSCSSPRAPGVVACCQLDPPSGTRSSTSVQHPRVAAQRVAFASRAAHALRKLLMLSVPPCARVTQNRSADTEAAGSSYASGFIVDAQRGLILTNRHVVTPGASLKRKALGLPSANGAAGAQCFQCFSWVHFRSLCGGCHTALSAHEWTWYACARLSDKPGRCAM